MAMTRPQTQFDPFLTDPKQQIPAFTDRRLSKPIQKQAKIDQKYPKILLLHPH